MVIGRNLVLSTAQDGVTLVVEEIVVIMDVVGIVVAVTIVGIRAGVSHGSACVTQAGVTVVEVFHGSACARSFGKSVGERFIGMDAGIETARLATRRFSNSLCRSSA